MTENFGADGTPHLTYYDKATLLSFVVDPVHGDRVAVSHGGYAEPVFDVFVFVPREERLDRIFAEFRDACVAYVQAWKKSRDFLQYGIDYDKE